MQFVEEGLFHERALARIHQADDATVVESCLRGSSGPTRSNCRSSSMLKAQWPTLNA